MLATQSMDIDQQTKNNSDQLSIEVLTFANEARMTYGLRHQDYQRYREHCTRRIHRLRQGLKLAEANNKNPLAKIPSTISDVRYLQLYVYEVERDWAYAMELKHESATTMNLRKRHHYTKRLKRASQHAKDLYELCNKQHVDYKTNLDVKAYAATMRGYLCVEQQQWEEALRQFITARTIYERFAMGCGSPKYEEHCLSAIDAIDPNIRFCAYKLRLNDSASAHDVNALMESLKKKDTFGMSALEAELAKIDQDNQKQRAQSLAYKVWNHKQQNEASEEPLIEHLDNYPAALVAEGSRVPKLVEIPPRFEPVACKPFLFDLAANHVQYPDDLTSRAEKPSGLFSKLFGFGKY